MTTFDDPPVARPAPPPQPEQVWQEVSDLVAMGLPDTAVFQLDLNGRIVAWGAAAQRLYGYAAGEVMDRPASRALARGQGAKEAAGEQRACLRTAARTGRHEGRSWQTRKDGSRFPARVVCVARRDAGGGLIGYTVLAQDLSEWERAEAERARLAAVVGDSEDAIFRKGLDGTVRSWNAAARRLFGYDAAEIVGKPVALLIPPDRLEEERRIIARLRRGRRVEPYETVRLTKDGRPLDVSMAVSPIRDADGGVVEASVIVRDISDRKRAEAALRDSESRFRFTYEHAPVGIEQVALDDGRLLDVNRELCRILGYTRRELLSRTFADLTDPADLAEEMKLLRRLTAGEIPSYSTEKRCRHKDGRPVWVRVTTAKAGPGQGRGQGSARPYRISVVEDVTERKKVEAALREGERRVRAILETAVDAILTIDERGIIESANPSTERLFGYAASEMIARNVKLLMPEPYHSEHDKYLRDYLRTGRARIIGIGREVTAQRKDGSTFPIHLSVSEVPLEGRSGRRLFTGIIHDLTNRRELEKQIIEASTTEQRRIGQDLHDGLCQDLVGVAFQADAAARQLRAAVSAPDPAGGGSSVVPANPAATEAAAAIDAVAASVREAAGQARQLSHGLNPVDLRAGGLPPALEALARKVSQSFGVSCTFHHDGRAEVRDDVTATHLYRIAQEAIGNAIKHGKADRIEVRLTSAGRLRMTVRDNGTGLGQVDPLRTKPAKPAGPPHALAQRPTGIGLHTMQYRASAVGGVFNIRPHPAGGTVVTCTLGDSPAPTATQSPQAPPSPRATRATPRPTQRATPRSPQPRPAPAGRNRSGGKR